ncbi:MAG: type IV pilus modification protein PilV [Neptuniibacter caesariensis]|uniref:Type IV pilus modification protein PilV n=1 Tax=Neptuniibacter caesariensis TaxID=207954 RepID=A0A2G6JAQ9_NEPCE|nr:MAG: type IV pilus modification protein PilV [Neptuniibacter caesariensis]
MTHQKGSSLIEVLVAVVVISIGILSVASLQTMALKSNNGSYLRSQATFLAYDLADRMRAAPDASAAGAYDDGQGGDRAEWDTRVVAELGSGAIGSVVRNNRQATINVQWNDNRARIRAGNDADQTSLTTFSYPVEF